MPQINFFQILCSLIIGLLRPLSVPLEMFCHEDVGERYPGFASIVALLTAETWCYFSDDVFPLHTLMVALVVRLIVHRVLAIRRRLLGASFVPSRSPGKPLLARVIPQIPEQMLIWLEPVALVIVSVMMCLLSSSVGSYLLCGSTAWLIITFVRSLAAYNRVLDQYDADPQAATGVMTGRYFEVVPSKPTIEGRDTTDSMENIPLPLPTSIPVAVAQA